MAKQRKIMENQNIALVNYRLSIEKKKAERMQNNLHLLDNTRDSNHIEFVSNVSEVKDTKIRTNHTPEEFEPTTYESRKVQKRKEAKQAALA